MKRLLLLLLLFFCAPSWGMEDLVLRINANQLSFSTLPHDVQRIIQAMALQNIPHIALEDTLCARGMTKSTRTDLSETVKNMAHFAQINKSFHAFLNNPKNIKLLLLALAHTIIYHDELSLAHGLKNMPGMRNVEIKKWIAQRSEEITLENKLTWFSTSEELDKALQMQISINAQRKRDGASALIRAIDIGADISCVKKILHAGIDVNIQDKYGMSALMLATNKINTVAYVEEILKYKPNVYLKNYMGETALDMALNNLCAQKSLKQNPFLENVHAIKKLLLCPETQKTGTAHGDCL